MKKEYAAVDLLKFVMALFVVMIHVKPNQQSPLLTELFNPILSIAVPVFFVISSTFIFSKLTTGGGKCLIPYCRRIGILYLSWMLIDSWYIIHNMPYFSDGFPLGFYEFIKDVLFATTFPGSWFLSALLVSVVFVYFVSKIIGKYATLVLTLVLSLYVGYIDLLPYEFHQPYDWYSANVREDVGLSFPGHMVWISFGQLIGTNINRVSETRHSYMVPLVIISLICYIAKIFLHQLAISLVFVIALCLTSFIGSLSPNKFYIRLRNYSILIFFIHFSIAGKMSLFCSVVGNTLITNWLYYLLVIMVSIVFAETVLRLEKHRYLKFLHFLH